MPTFPRRTIMRLVGLVAFAYGLAALAEAATAQPASAFFKGKTINLVIGTSAGNDYDYRGRLLARYLPRHIPGEPTIVARNMPGGGGVQAANWLASQAPRDGTALHMIMQNMMSAQAMGAPGVAFDARRFIWIGTTTATPNVVNAWYTSPVRTIEDVKSHELVVGAPMGTVGAVYPELMNKLVGTKFKVVTGYPGGNEVNIAMERGEVDGRGSNAWASWKSTKPQWVAEKKIVVLVQVGLKRAPDLPDVPLLLELAKNEDDRQVLTFISADTAIARSLVTAPDVPADRVALLRSAFDATMKDPDFLAEAAKSGMDISPLPGAEAQTIADSIVNTPAAVVDRAKMLIGEQK